MTDEIKIWAIDGASRESRVTEVAITNRTETERSLEEALTRNPHMLMPGLVLVGRQTPTDRGPLDLLGVDSEGQLVVFELKRGTVTRDAVTQVLDYASSLESKSEDELASHIAEQSGTGGIDKIDDFEEWYGQRFAEQELASLKPVQMALVGIGADDSTIRMVDFLEQRGTHISLLTFHGFKYGGQTLLARHVQAEPDSGEESRGHSSRKERREARERAALERAAALGIDGLLKEVIGDFKNIGSHRRVAPRMAGYTSYRLFLRIHGHDGGFSGSYAVAFTTEKKIRITFYPIAIHLCQAAFDEAAKTIRFHREPPRNAPPTPEVAEQWVCTMDGQEWRRQRETLIGLAGAVYQAWTEAARGGGG